METKQISIYNCEDNTTVERKMTETELLQYNEIQATALAQRKTEATKAAEKAALLAKLGITADEAALLLL